MMRDIRIVFMGTPNFAVATLAALVKAKYKIVGVITAPDKPAGRGRKLAQSAVKKYALENNLNLLQPTNLKDDNFLNNLKELNANLQIVVAFRMLPKVVWQMPKYGTFNLHASLLPNYRGAAPINWAIINGEKTTGVTTFFINENIDTGNIILQQETGISNSENVGQLHDKLMKIGSELVLDTVTLIKNNNAVTKEQPNNTPKLAPKIYTDTCKIDWSKPKVDIYNLIRGLNPYPAAWTFLINNNDKIKVKIYDVVLIEQKHNLNNGSLRVEDKSILVAVESGFIKINSLQLAGKKKMDTKSLLNGFQFSKDAYMQ